MDADTAATAAAPPRRPHPTVAAVASREHQPAFLQTFPVRRVRTVAAAHLAVQASGRFSKAMTLPVRKMRGSFDAI